MADSPVADLELELKWEPHAGQRAVLNSEARFRIVVAGRRWGKTEMAALDLLAYALRHPGVRCWWVSPAYKQADVGWDRLRRFILDLLIAPDGVTRSQPKQLELQNGSTIRFESANDPETLRGSGVDFMVIDEAARLSDAAWQEVLRPMLADTEGRMLAISTPAHHNWFYEAYQYGQSADHPFYESFQFPTSSAPHIEEAELDEQRRTQTDRRFRQEWEAEFVADANRVFPAVREHVSDYDYEAMDGEEPYTIGVDFARQGAYTVVIALDGTGHVVAFERETDLGWPQVQRLVERVTDDYPGTCYLDATRDNKIVADLETAGVEVEPVIFTASTKRTLIENLITTFEQGELTLPKSDPLIAELRAYQYETTETGNVRYRARTGFHDDCVDALALAANENYEKRRAYQDAEAHAKATLAIINANKPRRRR